MKVFVVGSTGRVGQEVLKVLVAKGHQVTAGARKPEAILQDGVEKVSFDLSYSVDEMVEAIKGHDAILDVAGSAGKNLLQIDLYGNTKLMDAAEKAGVKRFVLLSTIFALEPERWVGPGFEALKDYYIAKYFADLYLTGKSDLDYRIVQAGSLKEEVGTGEIAVNDGRSGSIPIPDVAETLVASLEGEALFQKVFSLHSGEDEILEALKQL